MSNGKGSTPRPLSVTPATYAANYARIQWTETPRKPRAQRIPCVPAPAVLDAVVLFDYSPRPRCGTWTVRYAESLTTDLARLPVVDGHVDYHAAKRVLDAYQCTKMAGACNAWNSWITAYWKQRRKFRDELPDPREAMRQDNLAHAKHVIDSAPPYIIPCTDAPDAP